MEITTVFKNVILPLIPSEGETVNYALKWGNVYFRNKNMVVKIVELTAYI